MCENIVEQTVPRGEYDYKVVTIKCGNTGWYGSTILCDTCQKKPRPQIIKEGSAYDI